MKLFCYTVCAYIVLTFLGCANTSVIPNELEPPEIGRIAEVIR